MTGRRGSGGIWAVVPVKRFDRAKTRLADAFSPAERRDLARAMVADVFATLRNTPGLTGVLVVTSDLEAQGMARALDFAILSDPGEGGLNAAAAMGLRAIAERGGAAALVVPGDIPFVSVEEIGAVVAALDAAAIVIAPAARDGGTNMLGMAPTQAIALAFGRDSAARHVAAARALGCEPAILHLPGASRDIDIPADLAGPLPAGAIHTRGCLAAIQAATARSTLRAFEGARG